MKPTFYITTTLPYVNAEPHIGFASEIVRADVIARMQRSAGKEVVFNTGTDEHGMKIYRKAQELGMDPQVYCDELAGKFDQLKTLLDLSYTHFIRTTDPKHQAAAQEFWRRCNANGYIYKKNYKIKYCVGCELEKTDSELIDGRCPIHPSMEIELIDEENYFFKFSAFTDRLKEFYAAHPDFVRPEQRYAEIKKFVEMGLDDFSISRLKSKMSWGVPVPDDDDHVMYVWFDALVNYISTIGWPTYAKPALPAGRASVGKPDSAEPALPDQDTHKEMSDFERFWPGMQIAGKDNLRQQSAMWQAMLMAAGLPNTEHVLINGFVTVDGMKMSKSLGNVILPGQLVDAFGVDATRYLLMTMGVFGEDADVTWQRLTEKYNADLANGLGNLAARSAKLAARMDSPWLSEDHKRDATQSVDQQKLLAMAQQGKIELIAQEAWNRIRHADQFIEQHRPWELSQREPERFSEVLNVVGQELFSIAIIIEPLMPQTAQALQQTLKTKQNSVVFPRKVADTPVQ